VSINLQQLEFAFSIIVWVLISPDLRISQLVTSKMGFRERRELLKQLYRYVGEREGWWTPDRDASLGQLLTRASTLEEQRDRLIHSTWLGGEDEDESVVLMKLTRKGALEFNDWSSATGDALADDMATLAQDVLNFVGQAIVAGHLRNIQHVDNEPVAATRPA
jgi:hypothetical protein